MQCEHDHARDLTAACTLLERVLTGRTHSLFFSSVLDASFSFTHDPVHREYHKLDQHKRQMNLQTRTPSSSLASVLPSPPQMLALRILNASSLPPMNLSSAVAQLMTFQMLSTYAAFPFRYCK